MRYLLRYSEDVRRALRTLPGFYRQRARRIVEDLADNPFPPKSHELRDAIPGGYRIPLGRWRIIYQVDEEDQIVYVLDIRPKTGPETYEGLDLEIRKE